LRRAVDLNAAVAAVVERLSLVDIGRYSPAPDLAVEPRSVDKLELIDAAVGQEEILDGDDPVAGLMPDPVGDPEGPVVSGSTFVGPPPP
jgi:hypothetical protein